MLEYYVAIECGAKGLQDAVGDMMRERWTPVGGIAIDPTSGSWAQALVRERSMGATLAKVYSNAASMVMAEHRNDKPRG